MKQNRSRKQTLESAQNELEIIFNSAEQSRPQSPRYPCPAERENEDLWEDAFELGISLAIDRACSVPPEVDKQ